MSIKKISELAGVSKTTVSFVLNGRGDEMHINKDTQKKILKIAKENNYQANFIAKSLSTGKTFTLALIVPDISNPFYGKIARAIEYYADEAENTVFFSSTGEVFEKELMLVDQFKARQVDGIILASCAKNSTQVNKLSRKNVPVLFFDRVFPGQSNPFVDINNFESAFGLTRELIRQGHQRIALLSLTSFLPNIMERINGYKKALMEEGIPINNDLMAEVDMKNRRSSIKRYFNTWFSAMDEKPSAFLFLNNVIAAEGIWVVNQFYKALKDRLLFASFDNLDLFDYATPKVISAIQPIDDLARECVLALSDQIDKRQIKPGIRLETSIMVR